MVPPPDDAPQDASFLARLRERFGGRADPRITLQADEAQTAEESPSRRLYLDLSSKDPAAARYEVRGEIARGGMGAILRVWDGDLRRNLAMKVLVPPRSGGGDEGSTLEVSEELLGRFLEEAQITGQLDHPGIVPVHDLGIDARGRVYFTMRLVRGRDLKQVFDLLEAGEEGWSRTKALGVVLRVCEAMAFAHSKGVVHRDLKPANVMVGRFGETYVMDWGLAKVLGRPDGRERRARTTDSHLSLVRTARREEGETDPQSPLVTMDGDVVGTPSYMAPEQAAGRLEELGPRSDVYALGAILYQMLSGRAPYVEPGERVPGSVVLTRALEGPPRPIPEVAPDVPAELVAICDKAMARDPAARYEGMLAMAADIEAYLEGRVVHAYEGGAVAEFRAWVRRNRSTAAAIGVAIVLALGGLGGVAALQKVRGDEIERAYVDLADARDRAVENELAAVTASRMAQERAREAQEARHAALENEQEARRSSYRANVAAADYSVRLNEIAEAKRLLALCDEDLRGWEWHHLALRLESSHGAVDSFNQPVRDVAFAADGGRFVVLSNAGAVRAYDLPAEGVTPEQVLEARVWPFLSGPQEEARLALSPDGELAALVGVVPQRVGVLSVAPLYGGEGERPFEHLRDLAPPGELDGLAAASALAFGPRGRLAVGYEDGGLRVWDPRGGEELWHLPAAHADRVNALAWSPDGALLATSGDDARIELWDADAGLAVRTLAEGDDPVTALAFRPDGERLAAAGGLFQVRVLDVASGATATRLPGHTARVNALAFSPDGRWLASGADDLTLRVWELDEDGRELGEERVLLGHEGPIQTVAFDPRGGLLVTGSTDGTVRTWDPAIGGAYTALFDAEAGLGHVDDVAFSPDGDRAVTAHDDGTVAVWDAWSGSLANVLRGHEKQVTCAAWSADGRWIASGSHDKTAIVWDARSGRAAHTLRGHTKWIRDVVFAPDGRWVATASGDETARVWDARTGELVRELRGHGSWVNALAATPDGAGLWTGSADKTARLWDVATGEVLALVDGHDDGIRALSLSPDGRRLVVGYDDGTIRACDATTGEELVRFATVLVEPVLALAHDTGGRRVAAGSTDGLVRIYDPEGGEPLVALRGHRGMLTGVAFAPDDRRLLTGSRRASEEPASLADQPVRIWETGALADRRERRRRAETLREEVEPLVAALYSRYFYTSAVLRELERQRLSEEALEAARSRAIVLGLDAHRLADESWRLARAPGSSPRELAEAFDRAEAATAMAEGDPYCAAVLGACQLRLGRLPAARRTLLGVLDALDPPATDDERVTRAQAAALLALTEVGLGRDTEARTRMRVVDLDPTSLSVDRERLDDLRSLAAEASAATGVATSLASPAGADAASNG